MVTSATFVPFVLSTITVQPISYRAAKPPCDGVTAELRVLVHYQEASAADDRFYTRGLAGAAVRTMFLMKA